MTDSLIAPHGGTLVDLVVDEERAAELKGHSRDWPSWDLTARQFCDLELLIKANRRVSTTVEKGLVRAVDAGSDGLEWLLKRAQKRLGQA